MKILKLALFLFPLLLFACKNVVDKRPEFVKRYNKQVSKDINPTLLKSQAELMDNNRVKIDVYYKSAGDTLAQDMLKNSVPLWVKSVLLKDSDFQFMIDHKVKFNVNLFTENAIPIDTIIIDKQYVNHLLANKENIDTTESKLRKTLYLLNKSLPIKAKDKLSVLTSASLSPTGVLEFQYEVTDDMVSFFKVMDNNEITKTEMIDRNAVRDLILSDKKREINKIRAVFNNKNGKQINAADLDIETFKNERNMSNIKGIKSFQIKFKSVFNSELPIVVKKNGIQLVKVSLSNEGILQFTYLIPASYSAIFSVMKVKENMALGSKPKETLLLLNDDELKIKIVESIFLNEEENILHKTSLTKEGFVKLFQKNNG